MYPFHLDISNETSLYQLKDGRFQFTTVEGEIEPIMVGYKYVLVNDEIASALKKMEIKNVQFEPAIIWNRGKDIEFSNYQLLQLDRHFESDMINDIDLGGKQFLFMDNRYLFATPELKDELELSAFSSKFSKGLSQFA